MDPGWRSGTGPVAYCLSDMEEQATPGDGGQRPAVAPVIRAGCLALSMLGAVSLFLATPAIVNPDGIQCSLARTFIEDANDDGRRFNDVDTGGREVDALSCDEALALADGIRTDEEDVDRTASVPSGSLIRNRGILSAIVAIGQGVTGFLTLTTLRRRARTAALVFVALGVVVPVLGLVSVAVLGFVIYAIAFSAPSRALWPSRVKPSGSS
jgi:hypothetical protein